MARRKICHAFTRIREEDGGLVRSVVTLVHGLVDRGHEVTLATAADSRFPGLWEAADREGLAVVPLEPPLPGEIFDRRAMRRLGEVFRDADVLHLHGMWRLAAHQMAALARRLDKPYVMTVHGRLDDWSMGQRALPKRLFYWLFERRNLAAARRVHVTAEAEAEQARAWIPHPRLSIIPYLVDAQCLTQPPDAGLFSSRHPHIDTATPSVLYLGRLHPKKGPEILIDACAILRRRGIAFRLLVAGPGEPEYVAALRARAADRVPDALFLGMVTGAEKYSLYAFADLLALPTSQENFGLVLAEALSQGTPVITTRGTDVWPEMRASGGAMLVERTAEGFADAIEEALGDPRRLREVGLAGREWVRRWLEPGRLLAEYERMYDAAITG
jgi:glycosyltransferase involved in cell wall biosynthesis